jgi:hypothetical protein
VWGKGVEKRKEKREERKKEQQDDSFLLSPFAITNKSGAD